MHRLLAAILFSALSFLLYCPTTQAEDPVPPPSPAAKDIPLEIGAQLNPFANSFTQKIRYINVSRVKPGSVAQRAGLLNSDHIIEINGLRLSDYRISEVPDIRVPAVEHRISVPMKVVRKGVAEPVSLTLVFEDCDGVFVYKLSDSQPMKDSIPRAK